jgi:hypothetical protein
MLRQQVSGGRVMSASQGSKVEHVCLAHACSDGSTHWHSLRASAFHARHTVCSLAMDVLGLEGLCLSHV